MIRDIVIAQQKQADKFERSRQLVKAVTAAVQSTTSIAVTGRPGYIWVKEFGQDGALMQVFNTSVQDRAGLPVLIGYEPKPPFRRMVIGMDWEIFAVITNFSGSPYLPNHHTTHEWPDLNPAPDAVSVYARALVPLRTYAYSGMTIGVAPAVYVYNGVMTRYSGGTLDLTSYIPANTDYHRQVLIYLNIVSNTAAALAGTEVPSVVAADYEDLPAASLPSAWVELTEGMTTVYEYNITDARAFLAGSYDMAEEASVRRQLAILDAEMDMAISRHIVEG